MKTVREFLQKIRSNWSTIQEVVVLSVKDYFYPLVRFMFPLWTWVVSKYKTWYRKLAYKDGVHNTKRGARAIFLLTVSTVLSFYVNIWYVIPTVGRIVYDMIAFEFMSKESQEMWFSKPEWITASGDRSDTVLSTFGCDSKPCTDENSREYRFRDSLYLDIKYWVTRFEPYDHSDIAGIMQGELNYCKVVYYGKRFKPMNWYPFIYNVQCFDSPVVSTNK